MYQPPKDSIISEEIVATVGPTKAHADPAVEGDLGILQYSIPEKLKKTKALSSFLCIFR